MGRDGDMEGHSGRDGIGAQGIQGRRQMAAATPDLVMHAEVCTRSVGISPPVAAANQTCQPDSAFGGLPLLSKPLDKGHHAAVTQR